MADDLLSDRESPIAPTLQILLSKMWQTASAADRHAPAFSKAMYGSLQRDGLLLGDFLDQQLTRIGQKAPELLSSGLAMDVLAYHTTPLLTTPLRAARRAAEDIRASRGRPAAAAAPVRRLYLADRHRRRYGHRPRHASGPRHAGAPRPRALRRSVLPGQRARRLLDAHGAEWRNKTGSVLDANDLEIVRQGMAGTRALRPEEERLIQASEEKRRQEVRNQHRTAMVVRAAAVIIGAPCSGAAGTFVSPTSASSSSTPRSRRRSSRMDGRRNTRVARHAGEIAASETAHAELQRLLNAPPPPQSSRFCTPHQA